MQRAADFIAGRHGPAHAAGALGEPGRLLARDDRRRDRRAGLRRRDRPAQRRRRLAPHRYLATADAWQAKLKAWTRDDERPATRPAVLPAPDQGRQPERRHDVHASATAARRRSTSAPSWTRASSSWSGSASCRADDPAVAQHARGGRPAASASTPNGRVLAPLQLRRLRREARRRAVGRQLPATVRATLGRAVADLRRRAGRVRARRRATARARRAAAPRWPATANDGRDAARAGLGPAPAVGPARVRARDADVLGDPAGVDTRPVHPAGLVDRTPGTRSSSRRSWPAVTSASARSGSGHGRGQRNGRAVASRLQDEGFEVLAVDLRPDPDGPGVPREADLTDADANAAAMKAALDRFGAPRRRRGQRRRTARCAGARSSRSTAGSR